MTYKIENDFNSIDPHKWAEFVKNHPCGNFFQTPAFYDFISGTPSYQPVVAAALSDNGCISGIIVGVIQKEKGFIKQKVSSRLIVWGGPLFDPSHSPVADYLLKTLVNRYKNRCIYIEFRNLFTVKDIKTYFEQNGFVYSEYLNYIVNIENEKRTFTRISDSKRRQIKKSLANGARILENVTIEQVNKFYNILSQLYSRKIKKPMPDWLFFEHFFNHPELGKYFLIEFNGEIIGGIMCPLFTDKIIYEWYIVGEDGKHKGVYPSVLATWAPIDYAIRNGLKQFDFLGAGKPDADYGVREFKAGFGGELIEYGRYTRINNHLLYSIGKAGLRILKLIK